MGRGRRRLASPARKRALRACESTWTRANSVTDPDNPTIIVDPPADLPVTTAPDLLGADHVLDADRRDQSGQADLGARRGAVGLHIHAVDASPSETLAYHAVGLPAGLSINAGLGSDLGHPHRTGAVARDGDGLGLGGQRGGQLRLDREAPLSGRGGGAAPVAWGHGT